MPEIIWSADGRGGLEAALWALTAGAPEDGSSLVWLVPEPYSHLCERLLAQRGGPAACLRAEVLTFGRLCDRVLSAEGGLARPVLDAGGRLLTLRLALEDVRPELSHWARAARRPDFLPGLLAAADECKCYGVGPQRLLEASALAEGPPAARLRELGLILGAFERRCASGAMDPRDRYDLLAEKLRQGSWAEGRRFHVSHFVSLTLQERRVLALLAERGESFALYMAGLPDEGRFPRQNRAVGRLFPRREELRVTVAEGRGADSPSLRRAAQCWWDPVPGSFEDGGVELWRASSPAGACRHAAERIIRLVTEEGLRLRDITVLAAGFETYGPLLAAIFPQYGVPLFMDSMDSAADKPLARLLAALRDCAARGCRTDDVVALLRTGLTDVTQEQADRLEDYVTLWRIGRLGGARPWTRPTGGWPGGAAERPDPAQSPGELEALRRRLLAALRLDGGGTALRCAQNLLACLESLGVPDRTEARAAELAAAGEGKLAAEAAQMWDIFCDSLEQCAAVLGDRPLDLPEFIELLLLDLEGRPVGSIPSALDRVTAGDIGRTARLPVPVVLVLGASDAALPAREDPPGLLAREERAALARAGAELPPAALERLERSLFDIYSAVALPDRRLIVCYPLDDTGEDQPSLMVTRLAELTGAPVREAPPPRYPAGEEPAPPSRAPLTPALSRALYGRALRLSASRLDSFQNCAFAYFCRYGLRLRPKRPPGLRPPDVGLLIHAVLEKTARRVMDEGGFGAVPPETAGRWAGEYAAAYLRDLLEDGGELSARLKAQTAALRRAARALGENMARELADSEFAPLGFEIPIDTGERPIEGAPEGGPEALRLRGTIDRADGWMKDGTLYLRVIDYKSGVRAFSLRDVYYGLGVQTLLYLFRLREEAAGRFGAARVLPAGALYVPAYEAVLRTDGPVSAEEAEGLAARQLRRSGLVLDELPVLRAMEAGLETGGRYLPVRLGKGGAPGAGSSVASAAQMGRLAAHVDRVLLDMARAVADGEVGAAPLRRGRAESACDQCDYRAACHYDRARDGARSMRSMTAAQALAALTEEEGP